MFKNPDIIIKISYVCMNLAEEDIIGAIMWVIEEYRLR